MLFEGFLGYYCTMININHEGVNPEDTWDEKDTHIKRLTKEQEDNLDLHEYLVMREKFEVRKLELADLNQDEMVKNMLNKLDSEIAILDEKIAELGDEKEVKA